MSELRLQIGIIGAGWFASRRHAPDLAHVPGLELSAACRRDAGALAQFCDHFNIPNRFSDYSTMIRETPLDAVIITSPHALHYEQAKVCLENGLHVLLEKPLALNSTEAAELCSLASQNNRVLLVALNPPYWAHCHRCRDWIAEGRIGKLEAVEITWINSAGALFGKEPLPDKLPGVVRPTSFRADSALGGGGHLIDGGQHNIAELLWVTGSPPAAITATMDQLPIDMRSSVSIRLQNGVIASITGLADSQSGVRRAHSAYYGSEGTLRVSVAPFSVTLERFGEAPIRVEETDLPPVPSPVADLLHCIQTGETPLGSSALALQTTRVIEAAYRSAAASSTASPRS